MSECGPAMEDGQGRRMSDPVRPLDRNFGVGGQLSRHRSFSNLQGPGAGRTPLHLQHVRGQEGFMNQQQYMNQVSSYKRCPAGDFDERASQQSVMSCHPASDNYS